MKITKIDQSGIDLTIESEGLKLKPYRDSVGIWTIGIGATHYENGVRVTKNDPNITKERAYELFMNLSSVKQMEVDSITPDTITQSMFNALCDFCYNGGIGMLKNSTLLSKIIKDQNDPTIANEFRKFVFAHDKNGKLVKLIGLINRREREILMYFKK